MDPSLKKFLVVPLENNIYVLCLARVGSTDLSLSVILRCPISEVSFNFEFNSQVCFRKRLRV